MKRLFIPLAILLVLAFIVAGCSSSSTSKAPTSAPPPAQSSAAPPASSAAPVKTSAAANAPQYGGTLRWIRNMGIPDIGAPSDTPNETFTLSLVSPILESLVTTDAQEHIMPALAEKIDIATDGKTITFHLIQGIKFQDGTPFNAAAVKYNFDKDISANCIGSAILKSVTAYDMPDDNTLVCHFDKYDSRYLLTLALTALGQIASPTALAKASNPQDMGKDHIVGTGPFKFDSWQQNQFIKMAKWDGYREKGKPYLDAIEIRNNSDITVSLMSFKAGEVNMVENIDPSDYNALKTAGSAVGIEPVGFVFSIVPDSANPDSPFKNEKVREALEYSIDKVSMCQGIGLGTQFPAYQCALQPPVGTDAWYMPDIAPRTFDVAKAKQLLADAGYPNGFSTTLTSDVRARQDQVVALQTYFKAIGINTTLDMADVARAATFGKDGWKGILVPGFPNFSEFSQWCNAFDDPIMTYPSTLRPDGWKAGWDAVISQTDFDKRTSQMKDMLRPLYAGAYQITYIEDGPRYVTDGKIHDMDWGGHHINGYFDPVNVWLSK